MPSTKLNSKKLSEFKNFAENLVKGAGKILLQEQKWVKILKFKDGQDITTSADLASEKHIIELIQFNFPDHSVLTEESGKINKGADYQWIVDPLDGTKEYSRKLPLFCVAVALQYQEETIVSAVYRPADANLYSAAKGLGAFHNGQKVQVSSTNSLQEAFIYCYLPSSKRQMKRYEDAWTKLMNLGKVAYRLRGLSDANSALSWLGCGGSEGYLNLSNPQPFYDIAAGLFIAKEGGAVVKDIKGRDLYDTNPDTFVAVNNKEIYEQVIEIIERDS